LLPAQADEVKQATFIAHYDALMSGLGTDEMVVFSDAVHPEHQSRPAHGWIPKGQKAALKATSGRKRFNIQGALDLETFQFTFVEGEKINALTTRQMLEKLERNNQTRLCGNAFDYVLFLLWCFSIPRAPFSPMRSYLSELGL